MKSHPTRTPAGLACAALLALLASPGTNPAAEPPVGPGAAQAATPAPETPRLDPAAPPALEAAPAGPADGGPAGPCLLCTSPPKPLSASTLKGLAWLAAAQNPDGGWGQGGGWRSDLSQIQNRGRVEGEGVADPSDIGNTAIALQAFLRAGTKPDGGPHAEVAAKAVAFLLGHLEDDNSEGLYVTKVRDTQLQSKIGTYIDTFLAAQILADLKGRLPDPADEGRRAKLLDRIVAKIQTHQRADGAYSGNSGWAATLSQGVCSKALNAAWAAGAKVDLDALEKDHFQNAVGLDPTTGAVAAGGAVGDAGVEIYRYASKLGGMTSFTMNNYNRRATLTETLAKPEASQGEKDQAAAEIAKIDRSDAEQQALLQNVAGQVGNQAFVAGFGNNGGEEFISYMNIGEALRAQGGDDWEKWEASMTETLASAQNADGSWAGQHCITGRTFCTSSALMVLMTDRAAPAATAPATAAQPSGETTRPGDPVADPAEAKP